MSKPKAEILKEKTTLDNYDVKEIKRARKYLVKAIYETRSKSKTELESKLKCGILTQDVLEYFVDEKRDSIDENDYSIEDDEEFWDKRVVVLDKKESYLEKDSKLLVEATKAESNIKSRLKSNNLKNEENMVNGEHLPSKDSSSLSQAKRTIHGCKENCLKNIKISELDASTRISYNLVFVCDVCFTIFQDQEMALFHINDFNHISASEFLMDKPMLNNNGSLKYVVNRCSIKSSSKNHSYGVFCPRDDCHFYFNNSILACGLHYQFHHNSHHQVYSLARFIRQSSLKIGKCNSCSFCETKFVTISELASHSFKAKHFPTSSSENEINLLECPFESCQYKSVDYYSFKYHIIVFHSNFFNEARAEPTVTVTVSTYEKPSSYLHIPRLTSVLADNKNANESFEDLNALYKNSKHEELYNRMYYARKNKQKAN
jgi:hypothetical protein